MKEDSSLETLGVPGRSYQLPPLETIGCQSLPPTSTEFPWSKQTDVLQMFYFQQNTFKVNNVNNSISKVV